MEKFFTNLSKCVAVMALAFIGLAGIFSAKAEEYKSMIRYDRVWEHLYIHWGDRRAYYVRFGGTEEINGKTYHSLEAFREVRYEEKDGKPYVVSVNDDYYDHEGYLREEYGKVYTLVVKHVQDNGFEDLQLYTPDFSYPDSSIIEEKLLYDFTCKEGESYGGMQIEVGFGGEVDYKVNSIEHLDIDGEDYRVLRVAPYDVWNNEWHEYTEPIVEGIGIASYGCLTTINFLHLPTCPCYHHVFNRVLSTDGRVLYRTADMCVEVPLNDFMGVEGIVEQPASDAPLYDILGRRISAPAPGQLYIQDGKKHIAK